MQTLYLIDGAQSKGPQYESILISCLGCWSSLLRTFLTLLCIVSRKAKPQYVSRPTDKADLMYLYAIIDEALVV